MKKAIVLHSDILGFKSILEDAEQDKEDETLNKLKKGLDEAVRGMEQFKSINKKASLKVDLFYKLFSDNLYASFSYDDSSIESFSDAFTMCLIFTRSYYSVMLDNNLAIRGAISFGSDYADERIIFSIALANAYVLETEKAKYPRIIIDETLMDRLFKNGIQIKGELTAKTMNSSILQDEENIYFLNPTGVERDLNLASDGFSPDQLYKGFIKRKIEFAMGQLEEMKKRNRPKEVDKYEWLIDILQWYITDFKKPSRSKFKRIQFNKE